MHTTNTPNRKPMTGGKFVAKGHDAILKRAQDSGNGLTVFFISGRTVTGRIIARDRYTFTLEYTETDEKGVETGREIQLTVYKHACEAFHPVSKH